MKFKLEFTFDISDSSLLIDANDGRDEEYTSIEDVPEDTLMDVVDKKKARREAKKHIENELQDQL